MYDQELKCQILDLLKIKSVKEVSEQFDISVSTLYRGQRAREDSKLIKKLIFEKRYEDARKIAKDYPNDGIIQSQLMMIYMRTGEYISAKEVAERFSYNAPMQSQFMTIYMKTRKDEKIVKDGEESPKEYLTDSEKNSKDLSIKKSPVMSKMQNSNNYFFKVKDNDKTLNNVLNQNYKAMILSLKIKYYKEMYDKSKRKSAIYKYDWLEENLSSEPSIKNFDLLLLMLIGDGNNCFDIEQFIPKQYHGEYKKVLNKIRSKKHRND